MVCFSSTITVDQPMKNMVKSVKSTDVSAKLRNKKALNSPNQSIPCCKKSRWALIDVIILIAVIIALGFLLFSFSKLLIENGMEVIGPILDIIEEEISEDPMIYGFLGLGMTCTIIAALAITVCASRRCGKPGCRGLHKAAEFDIQLETEDLAKKSDNFGKGGVKKGLFELPRDHHKELEAELKKMAPMNGKAVLIFRARCGCPIGRMEVPGPKNAKKVKK